jgi:hypothetical protein
VEVGEDGHAPPVFPEDRGGLFRAIGLVNLVTPIREDTRVPFPFRAVGIDEEYTERSHGMRGAIQAIDRGGAARG